MSLYDELRRRNVLRATLAYLAGAWLLIQIVETLFPVFGFPDGAIRTIVIILAIGFPPAVILAWIFEWSPQGLVRDDGVAQPSAAAGNRRIDRTIISILVVALALFGVDRFVLEPARDVREIEAATESARSGAVRAAYGEQSIAVLPFVNLSSDTEQEYLAGGIAEELLNLLAHIEGLRVISRTSAFAFKGSDTSLPEIAKQLDVAHILEGSVRRSGDTIRVTVQLIDARADAHLWSETYERSLGDIFQIQDQVAAHVVEQLRVAMDVRTPTAERHDPEAYALYLQASQLLEMHDEAAHQRVEDLLTRAIAMDPAFTNARVQLAWLYNDKIMPSASPEDTAALVSKRDETLQLAAADDPDNAKLNAAQAWFALAEKNDLVTAARHAERALRTNPYDNDVLNIAMVLEQSAGSIEVMRKIGAYLTRVDPLNYWAHMLFASALELSGEVERAMIEIRTAASLRPGYAAGQWKLGLALLRVGQPEAALRQFENAAGDPAYYHQGRALALHDLGRDEESAADFAELHRVEDQVLAETGSTWNLGFARAYAWVGDVERTIHYVEEIRAESPDGFLGDASDPMFDRIKDDPRWQAMLATVRERQAAIEFNPRLPPEILALD